MAAPRRERLPGTPAPGISWKNREGMALCGDAFGPEHGQQVLLLHGGGQARYAWRATGVQLGAAGYRAITLDARGHGDSDWSPKGDYEMDAFARDLVDVVAALGNRRPAVIGASIGGNAALLTVGEGMLDASALILVDIAPRTEPSGSARVKAFLERYADGFASLDEVAEAVAGYRPGAKSGANRASLARNVRLDADGRLYWHWDPRFIDGRDRDVATRHARLAPAAHKLKLPTLLIRGASSDVVSEAGVQEFLELCPHAEYVNIANADHMVTGDVNDVFGRATLDFLGRASGRV